MKSFCLSLILVFSICLISCDSDKHQQTSFAFSSTDGESKLPFRPNILWIVAEDLGPYISPFGDSTISTPNLSRLAAEGVRYTHVFSTSGVCSPSRAAIATGMYPNHIGANHMRVGGNIKYLPEGLVPYEAVPPPAVKMHSEYMRRAGYFTTNNAKEDYQFKAPVTAWDENGNQAHWKHRPEGKPFFSIFNLGVTHESRIWVKAEDSLWIDANEEVPIPPYLPDTELAKKDVRRMYSNIKEMDAQVGALLDELEEAGLMDSTIIFWYADHGGPLPRQKRLLYDSGLRLPLIIRFPNQEKAGEVDNQLISFIDFMPTIMSLAGVMPPAHIHGQAFVGPYQATESRSYIHAAADRFDEKYDMIRAVRDQRFKYLRNYRPEQGYYLAVKYRENMPIMQELLRLKEEGTLTPEQALWFREEKPEEELFDCENDPHELHNIADDPNYKEELERLRAEYESWMENIDDKGFVPETELLESIWPGLIQPKTSNIVSNKTEGRISLDCETEGASIGYQTAESVNELTNSWDIYEDPISVPEGESVFAVAHRLGYQPSDTLVLD